MKLQWLNDVYRSMRLQNALCICLLLIVVPCDADDVSLKDPLEASRARHFGYSHALSRWIHGCVERPERKDPLFSGCRTRLAAIQARWALARVSRIAGTLELSSQLDPIDWTTPSDLNDSEYTWRLAFLIEQVRATGEIRWAQYIPEALNTIYVRWKTRTCSLGSGCEDAIFWLLKGVELIQMKQELVGTTVAMLNEIKSWAMDQGVRLTSSHPNGGHLADFTRGSSQSWWTARALLAAEVLDLQALQAWASAEGIPTLPSEPFPDHVGGLYFSRAVGIGAIAIRLKTPQWFEAYEQHVTEGLKEHQRRQRDYRGYTYRVPALGVWALSAAIRENWRQWAIDYPPNHWRDYSSTAKHRFNSLPNGEVIAQGMFSKIALRDQDHIRTMYFVRPNGVEVIESQIDLQRPSFLKVRYTRDILSPYIFVPQIRRGLLVGLGGGAMVHALKAADPNLHLDVVEIDPVVVQLAREYFGVETTENTIIHTQDGFDFLRTPGAQYDVIFMDAFLQPNETTDSTGSPLKLKTLDFLREVRGRLTSEGALAININDHSDLQRDLDTFKAAFPINMIWRVPQTGNWIALGLNRVHTNGSAFTFTSSIQQLQDKAKAIHDHYGFPFSTQALLDRALQGASFSVPDN